VQNSFYYVNLGIPLLKGKKKDKIEIADEEVKEEKIIIAEEETFYPDYPDEGNKSLPNEKYMANNIIFLLDVSASMNQNEKMEKVKKAMIYMADSLRSFDQVGLVTYNVKAKVALEPTKSDAEHILDIKREIEVIRPKGSTKGIAGMETALEVAVGNYMNAANNQVILVTDGEFSDDNLSEKDLKEIVDEYKSQGVKISIIGFGESKVAQERLAFIASYAGGRYIKVESAEQFDDVFLKEIKLSSEKK
jgi:Ca-activated chloride channel family protein